MSDATLETSLKGSRVLAIALAAISPTTSVFLVYGGGLEASGTGIVYAFLLAAVIAISMAFAYAELGSVHSGAGGAYTIVREALGRGAGFVVLGLFLALGVISTAAILVASATYLHSLVDVVPIKVAAMVMMAVVTVLSLERLGSSSLVATVMLIVELVVIFAFIVATAVNAEHGFAFVTHPVASGGGDVPFSGVLSGIALALFAFNGYDWPLYFAEETEDARRTLPRAVIVAAAAAIVIEIVAVITATLAIGDLHAIASADSPLADIASDVAGSGGSKILLAGVVVAMFDTGLSANLGYARIYFASGRDDLWPARVAAFLRSRNGNGVPKGAFALLLVGCEVLCFFTSLTELITFTSVIIATVYALIAVSAIVSRRRAATEDRPFRMPLWPLPPVVALVGVAVAVKYQKVSDVAITAAIVVAAILYWLAYGRRLSGSPGALRP